MIRWLIGRKIAKIASSYPPQSHRLLTLAVTPFEFRDEPNVSKKLECSGSPMVRNHVRFDTIPDRQTDRQKDRRTAIPVLA